MSGCGAAGGMGGAETLYLLGHLEADVGTELEHFAHLLRRGWDQGNLLNGGRILQLFEPLDKPIVS